jgi:5,5'-dehydrodivanillate O-demethylase oxygenase subunit
MLTAAENDVLTRIGPGTRMGTLMRRYWHLIAAATELEQRWATRVRLLGEDLVLYKDRSGTLGLIGESCPHRRASMAYGIPTQRGIRCPYHGWEFNGTGRCLEMPNEPEGSTFKDKVHLPGYAVRELGCMLWAYLGPQPAPEIPQIDGYRVEGAIRLVGKAVLPCNWLQIMENSLDPVHTEWLHGNLYEFVKEQEHVEVAISRHHRQIRFKEFPYGIYKQRLLDGRSETADDWTVGHPIVFPYTLAVGNAAPHWPNYAYQIRVPMDDENTLHLWYNAYVPPAGAVVPAHLFEKIWSYDVPYLDQNGEYLLDMIDAQDVMAWITQGPIADRTQERLGMTDVGIVAYRKLLLRELAKAERGEDPMGVVRDPGVIIRLPMEQAKFHYTDGFESLARRTRIRYAPIVEDLIGVFQQDPRNAPVPA